MKRRQCLISAWRWLPFEALALEKAHGQKQQAGKLAPHQKERQRGETTPQQTSCPLQAEVADSASSRLCPISSPLTRLVFISRFWQRLCLFCFVFLLKLLFGKETVRLPCIPRCLYHLSGLPPQSTAPTHVRLFSDKRKGGRKWSVKCVVPQEEASRLRPPFTNSHSLLLSSPLSIRFYGKHLHSWYAKQRLLRKCFWLLNWAYKASPPLHFSLFINLGGGT